MAKYIVFEKTGDVRVPSDDEYADIDGEVMRGSEVFPKQRTILRRLTDEEVAKLVTPQPADDERERFVRETAARLIGTPVSTDSTGAIWYRNIEESIADAESLAARLWEKRA